MSPTSAPKDVKPDIRHLAVNRPSEEPECFLCYETSRRLKALGDDAAHKLFEALLMSRREKHATLWVCLKCRPSINEYMESIRVLENARIKFNDQRNKLGRKIYLRPEGKSKEDFDRWESEVNSVEDFFPSRMTRQRLEELRVDEETDGDVAGGGSADESEDLVEGVKAEGLIIKESNSGDEDGDESDEEEVEDGDDSDGDEDEDGDDSDGEEDDNVEPPAPLRRFPCPKCVKAYTTKSNLKQHLKAHDKVKPFRCDDCNYGTTVKCNYETHLLSKTHLRATNAA